MQGQRTRKGGRTHHFQKVNSKTAQQGVPVADRSIYTPKAEKIWSLNTGKAKEKLAHIPNMEKKEARCAPLIFDARTVLRSKISKLSLGNLGDKKCKKP